MFRKLKISNRMTGLTITEVIVASGLLIVAMVPILRALTTANLNTAVIERKTRSLALAQAKLDEIKAKSIYHYTNGGASFAQDNLSLDGSYLCNITDDLNDTLKTISVSVGYDYNGDNTLAADEIEITLTTLIARRWSIG
jgi:hypothetical protein